MKSTLAATAIAATLPRALGWGEVGHAAVAYVATDFVSNSTRSYFQRLLGDTSDAYLANVASWADEWKHTDEGEFSYDFHFIDAHDDPPSSCNVDLERDCGETGCVVSAVANYVSDMSLSQEEREIAAKLVIHFVGDIGQPLHCEGLGLGGNEVDVTFAGAEENLHTVWDELILETISGGGNVSDARSWASALSKEVRCGGAYAKQAKGWVQDISLEKMEEAAMVWATESNTEVCDVVMPEGVEALKEGDLAGEYTTGSQPTVALQVAKQGYRLAKVLDLIAAA